jgi:hypothetical protein
MPGQIVTIKPNGEVLNGTYKGKEPKLAVLQLLVDGYIEPVLVTHNGARRQGWVNEDGLRQGLEFNYLASTLCGQPIVGNLVVVEPSTSVDSQ